MFKFLTRSIVCVAAMMIFLYAPAFAATKYWDRGGGFFGIGFGSNLDGTWNNSNNNWNTSIIGWSFTQTDWDDLDDAIFAGTDSSGSYSVDIDGNIVARSISFTTTSDALIEDISGSSGTFTLSDTGTPTVNVSNASTQVTFDIGISGTGGFNKTGDGTIILTNESALTGNVSITGGTVRLDNAGGKTLDEVSDITISSGGTLIFDESNQLDSSVDITLAGGTLEASGNDQTLGTLTLTANSTLDVGATGSGDVVFDPSNAETWTPGSKLLITNWTGDQSGGTGNRIFFGGTLTEDQLSQIQFYGYDTGAALTDSGELVPVPEPSTYIFGVGLLSLILIHAYRKLKK